MNKLTDEQIVKALEAHFEKEQACRNCPLKEDGYCCATLLENAFDLINRQKVENERLLQKLQHPVVAENAITALREKCVEKQEFLIGDDNRYKGYVSIEDLDYIIEESGVRNY